MRTGWPLPAHTDAPLPSVSVRIGEDVGLPTTTASTQVPLGNRCVVGVAASAVLCTPQRPSGSAVFIAVAPTVAIALAMPIAVSSLLVWAPAARVAEGR